MRRSHATILVGIAERDFDLFHDRAGDPYATTFSQPRETYPLGAERFRNALARLFYIDNDIAPSDGALAAAITTLRAIALFDGTEHDVFLRVAERDGLHYVDLADERRRAVEIGPDAWSVVAEPPVRFLRPARMLPLPEPVRDGSLEELWLFLNLRDEDSFRLVVGFLLGAIDPRGPYPLLSLTGEQGSAKSTAATFLRGLVDPNAAALRSPPSDPRDLAVATRGSWVLAFDNVSTIDQSLSDALCRVLTGGAFSTRQLYTDGEEVSFEARRPVITTSIPEVIRSSDLADRALTARLDPIHEDTRIAEREVATGFEAARARLFGALCDAAGGSLANEAAVRLERLPRLADLALRVTASEPALGWPRGSFVAAMAANRDEAAASALESSIVGRHVVAVATEGFVGTPTDLLAELERRAGYEAARDRFWPRSPGALTRELARLGPDLLRAGIRVERSRLGHEGRRIVRIQTIGVEEAGDAAVLPFTTSGSDASAKVEQETTTEDRRLR